MSEARKLISLSLQLVLAELMKRFSLESKHLQREVLLDIVIPDFEAGTQLKLLVLNDGQDAHSFQLPNVMNEAMATGIIQPTLAVAVHVGERKQEYGVSHKPDFAKRGAKAAAYSAFIELELFPWIKAHFPVSHNAADRSIAGFSLGALSAFDIAWHQSEVFGTAGLFSGSFWWRSKSLEENYQPSDRIALQLVKESNTKKDLNLWFQIGWLDENADRDGDGLIDSIGDTLDLIRELNAKGYQSGKEIEYVEVGNGHHDHKTMARVFPKFLKWWNAKMLSSN